MTWHRQAATRQQGYSCQCKPAASMHMSPGAATAHDMPHAVPLQLSAAHRAAQHQDKQGNPLEFIGLLISLVKRW
jgi:hypothetical protein